MATAKIKFLKDIPQAGIKKGELLTLDIPAVIKDAYGPGDDKVYDPDCMDEISDFISVAVAVELEKRGLPRNIDTYPSMFYCQEDDLDEAYDASADDEINADDESWGTAKWFAHNGSVYNSDKTEVDHSANKLIEDETFFVMNVMELHDDLMDERDGYRDDDDDWDVEDC